MITDSETSFVYLADTLALKYPKFNAEFEAVLQKANVHYGFLPQTKDVWAVDYMPIQIDRNEFLNFKYYPDYLIDTIKWKNTISDTELICKLINLKVKVSDIVVDGGNVIRSENKVIMCDKVFFENPGMSFTQLTSTLEQLFQVDKIIFIPTHPQDKIGHADGLVRFYNDDTVLLNNFSKIDCRYEISIKSALKNAGLNFIEVPYNPYQNKTNLDATGIYMNYLEVGKTIVLPSFGMIEDNQAVKKFEELYPKHSIFSVDASELAKSGGILNCVTWNIYR